MIELKRALRSFPSMFRVGVAAAFAYRAEFIVWMLTTTMPLVMMALWTAVAAEAPFGRFHQADFVAYYLAALIVRTLTSCWLVWQMNQDARMGYLSVRLLRPAHPLFTYAAEHIAAIPMRAIIAVPVAVILLIAVGSGHLVSDPALALLVPLAVLGAWLITFFSMAIIGALGMIIERSVTVWEVWFGLYAVLSGYLVPTELLPRWIGDAAIFLPFRYMLGFPVELLTGKIASRTDGLLGLGIQWSMVVLLAFGALKTWNAGVRRYEAYGN